jgi:prepilin-type N-terminal cleavage/methylation domain-containing protein
MSHINKTIRPPAKRAFTLIELLAVICLIGVLSSLALPSVIAMFNSGADSQAYNLLASQLMAARSLAIRSGQYTCVHVQKADPNAQHGVLANKFLMAILRYDPRMRITLSNNTYAYGAFVTAEGYAPVNIPGNCAFGRLDSCIDNNGNYISSALSNDDNFTCFTIVFSPSGTVVTTLPSGDILFATGGNDWAPAGAELLTGSNTNSLFDNSGAHPIDSDFSKRVWDPALLYQSNNKEIGVSAVTLFDFSKFRPMDNGARADFLNKNGQFLTINVYTGQLFPR